MDDRYDTNLYIACFTTSYARMKLYEALDKCGENVLYYDTDSIIYIVKNNDDPLEYLTGSKLGELTDELNGKYIIEFSSGGPKNYSYKLNNNDIKCKVKGITLNFENQQKINFESMKEMIINYVKYNEDKPIKVEDMRFLLDKKTNDIHTNDKYIKTYQFNYDKRQIYYYTDYCIETLPYGHSLLTF
jgi:hypothetical protein